MRQIVVDSVLVALVVACSALLVMDSDAAENVIANEADTKGPQESGMRQSSLDDGWWTGPLYAATAATLPQGHIVIQPYLYDSISYGHYNDTWSKSHATRSDGYYSFSYLMYGLTDTFMVGVLPKFGYNKDNSSGSSAVSVGDTTLQLQYRVADFQEGHFIPTVSVVIQETFPSGRYDQLGTRPNSGLGFGAFTTTISVYSQYIFRPWNERPLRARLDVSYSFSDDVVSLRDVSVYGTTSGFRGRARPGSTVVVDAAFEYSLTRNWVPALDVIYEHDGSTSVSGTNVEQLAIQAIVTTIEARSSSSESFSLAPAMEFNWNENVGIIFGVAVTIAGRNTSATITPVIGVNIFL